MQWAYDPFPAFQDGRNRTINSEPSTVAAGRVFARAG